MTSLSLDNATPTFGERLRVARTGARMSQAELTRLSGVPKTMLSRYENDHILPSISTLHKLARAIGVGESALLGERKAADGVIDALSERGIAVATDDDAAALADVIVDMVDARDPRVGFLNDRIERRA